MLEDGASRERYGRFVEDNKGLFFVIMSAGIEREVDEPSML